MLKECFEEFGEVLEVFVIDSKAMSNVGCAFIRMSTLEQAENAIQELHEQRVLIPEQRDLGPMQVAFAKGEAIRLGLEEKEEILPSFKEARMKVVEHQEKRMFFEAMQKQQEVQQELMQKQQELQIMAAQACQLSKDDLVALIKDGQRFGGPPFKSKWWSYCDRGWQGIFDYDPGHHPQQTLAQFVSIACFEHGRDTWFKSRFEDLEPLPPGTPLPPPPFPMPPFPGGPPGGGPGGPGSGGPSSGPGGVPGGPLGLPPPPFPPGMPMPPMGMPGPPPFGPPGGPPFGDMPGRGGRDDRGSGRRSPSRRGGGGGGRDGRDGGGDAVPRPSRKEDVDELSAGSCSGSEACSDAGDIEDINADDI